MVIWRDMQDGKSSRYISKISFRIDYSYLVLTFANGMSFSRLKIIFAALLQGSGAIILRT